MKKQLIAFMLTLIFILGGCAAMPNFSGLDPNVKYAVDTWANVEKAKSTSKSAIAVAETAAMQVAAEGKDYTAMALLQSASVVRQAMNALEKPTPIPKFSTQMDAFIKVTESNAKISVAAIGGLTKVVGAGLMYDFGKAVVPELLGGKSMTAGNDINYSVVDRGGSFNWTPLDNSFNAIPVPE